MEQQPQTGSDRKYIQYNLLKISVGDKNNDLVIVNTKNNKEDTKIHIRNHVREDSWYTYVHTNTKYMHGNKEFYDKVIYI